MKKRTQVEIQISEEFIDIIKQLLDFFGGNCMKVRAWMRTPNPNLGQIAPLQLIAMGRIHIVQDFINTAREENGWTPRGWSLVNSGDDGRLSIVSGDEFPKFINIEVREVLSSHRKLTLNDGGDETT